MKLIVWCSGGIPSDQLIGDWAQYDQPYSRVNQQGQTIASLGKQSSFGIAAFTATADPSAQQTICKVLQLQQPEVFLISPYRQNLHLKVQTIWTPRGRRQQMLKFIQARAKQGRFSLRPLPQR